MKSFFKYFFASFLSIIVFTLIAILIFSWLANKTVESEKPQVDNKSVLLIDLSKPIAEQTYNVGFPLSNTQAVTADGLFDIVRAIGYAKKDSAIKGIYLKCGDNSNGFATSEELRNALIDFKLSRKFIIAYGDYISQKAYYVAGTASKLYCSPQGYVDWKGFAMVYSYLKGMLDKLEVKPEIFYAGQFKSATEPLREKQMTPANRLQSTVFLNELYEMFINTAALKTGKDTMFLRQLANDFSIHSAKDAYNNNLIDGLKYDDEVREEVQKLIGVKKTDKISFISVTDYIKAINWHVSDPDDKIALIYAEGEIVDGQGDDKQIGSEKFTAIIRKARLDKKIKAVVLRVNSPGGSSVASESIWREVEITKKEKPVIVSMGDYAASGGYYIACSADSIFAQPNTLTGSIGVFSVYANLSGLMNNKLGVTFDAVKTNPSADFGNMFRPMTEKERSVAQASTDSIYMTFKTRVAQGRGLNIQYIDSIAQGRIWSGKQALQLKLVDKLGNIQDAIDCAAHMAKLQHYQLKEYPVLESWWEKLMGSKDKKFSISTLISTEIGQENYNFLKQIQQVKSWINVPQTRLPFFAEIK